MFRHNFHGMSPNHVRLAMRALLLLTLGAAPGALPAQPLDFTWNFDDDGGANFILTSRSSTQLYAGNLPANDPTINLIKDKRYRVIVANPGSHPLEMVALGASSGLDTVLLSQGGAGSLEATSSVAWVDVGDGTVEFTASIDLINALTAGGKSPGYRCTNHPDNMRGGFDLYGVGSVVANPIVPRIPAGTAAVELELVASGLVSPVGLADPNDGSGRLFILDQIGILYVYPAGTPMLDLRSRMVTLNPGYDERGFLGLALHPNFAVNRKLYTYTSEPFSLATDFTTPMSGTPNHQSVVAEWVVSTTDPNVVDPSSRRELLRLNEPQSNHNGGQMRFGPDGKLYISLGDGGGADDEPDGHGTIGNGQNIDTILGSLLRIDVDGNNSANGKYGIPADNPFVGTAGIDEIFAHGFRNPFRFSFDRGTGDLYVADVGQNKVEEIDRVEKGKNYGWRLKEGSFYFDPVGATAAGVIVTTPAAPIPPGLVDPIAEYDHDDGISIIGGSVYRGAGIPRLYGRYVFGDFGTSFAVPSGRLFYLDSDGVIRELGIGRPSRPLALYLKSMDEDAAGEVYIFASGTLGPSGSNGVAYRLVRADGSDVPPRQWEAYD